MHQLTHPAIEAILKEWHPQKYRPPYTDVHEWIRSTESLCNLYGIPDAQWLQCAICFIKEELSTELRRVLTDTLGESFELMPWDRFKNFLVAFDGDFRQIWGDLPFYKKHPKRTAVFVGIAGGIVLAPAAIAAYVGLTTAGFAAGSASVSYQSVVRSSATRVLLSPQSAGTTTVMPSVGTIPTGAATTRAGALVATTNTKPVASNNSESLQQAVDSIANEKSDGDDDNEDPPPYRATALEEYFLTPRAILAIVKSWGIQTYNPPRTDCTTWLSKMHDCCERYGIPTAQRASCAMHHMGNDCKGAALDAGCCNMTWDKFTVWLRQYDHGGGMSANEKTMELLTKKSRM